MGALSLQAIMALTALVSMIGSAIGVYVGMKVGMAKLEMKLEIIDTTVNHNTSNINVLQDDSLIYDGELDTLYQDLGIHRAVRPNQRRRG